MATATATQTQHNGATIRETAPETMTVEAEITSGIFKGKMVDLTFSSDGSNAHMSDPKITPEEREAWDWMMQATRNAVETARELRVQNEESIQTMRRIRERLEEIST